MSASPPGFQVSTTKPVQRRPLYCFSSKWSPLCSLLLPAWSLYVLQLWVLCCCAASCCFSTPPLAELSYSFRASFVHKRPTSPSSPTGRGRSQFDTHLTQAYWRLFSRRNYRITMMALEEINEKCNFTSLTFIFLKLFFATL